MNTSNDKVWYTTNNWSLREFERFANALIQREIFVHGMKVVSCLFHVIFFKSWLDLGMILVKIISE